MKFRRSAICLLLAPFVFSCSDGITGPGTIQTPDTFSLLVDRRSPGGIRSFYTLGAFSGVMAPFTGVPVDARTLIPSPDGKTIAYLREGPDGFVRLWAMDRDGSRRRPIVDQDIVIESAAWSPDGTRFALAYSANGVSNDVATVNADGTGFVDLTPDPLPGTYIDRDPAWSPDGSLLAFTSNRSGVRRAWLMNADGSGARQVVGSGVASSERNPVWSPDGSFIAAVSTSPSGPGMTFVRPDGTDLKIVPISPGPNDPLWLPDGRVVFNANPNGNFDLFSIDHETGVITPLTSRLDDDVHASVLANAAPFNWLGFQVVQVNPLARPAAFDLEAAHVVTDTLNDLLVLTPSLHELRVLRSVNTGEYQTMGALFAESSVIDIAAARVSPDALTDFVGHSDSAAYLWVGRVDGPGVAKKSPMLGLLRDQALVDANADGRFDIVSLVERGSTQFRIVTRVVDPSDSMIVAADMLTQRRDAKRMCAGDVNGDGFTDLLILAGTTSLSPLLAAGRRAVGFDQPISVGASLSTDLAALPVCADFNGDGKDDLVLVRPAVLDGVSIRLFRSTSFGPATTIPVRGTTAVAVDIDRDGDMDLVIGNSDAAELFVVANRGDGRFDTPTRVTLNAIPTLLIATDLNGDTWPDVALVDVNGALEVLISRGRIGM